MQATATRRRLGEFELIEEIGRGGMGIVFRAERIGDGRVVAVKVLPAGVALDADAVERFTREAEAVARLTHPGILPILAFGEDQGVHYFATDLIEGPSLEVVVAELRLRDPGLLARSIADETTLGVVCPGARARGGDGADAYARSCAAIAADLASALAEAHAHHLIHRDVKPGNVLIDRSGQAKLVDFGLSRDETAAGLTRSGDAVGTPAYMAPEQASGRKDLDARVDVWGLGATLYELLTLRPPFRGSHPGKIMRSILEDEVVPVRTLNPAVPVGLANIVHMCLRKDRAERYADAASLECDLRAFLEGSRIAARPLGALRRLRDRWRGYARPVALAVSAASVLVAALLGSSAWWRQSALRQGQAQLAEAARAVQALDVAAAEAAYTVAGDLLGNEHVARARVEHLEAVPGPEDAGAIAAFRTLLDAVPALRRGPRTEALRARVEGTGRVRLLGFEAVSAAPTLHATGAAEGARFVCPSDGVLAPGSYRLEATAGRGVAVRAFLPIERGGTLSLALPELNGVIGPVLLAEGPVGPIAFELVTPPPVAGAGADARRSARAEAARLGCHVLHPGLVTAAIAAGGLPAEGSDAATAGVWFARALAMPDALWAAERAAVAERLALAAARGEVVADWTLAATGQLAGGATADAELYADGDAFVLRLPLAVPGAPTLTRLSLPVGTVIEDVQPVPARTCWHGGRLELLFEPGRGAAAFVRFRRSGGLGEQSPETATIVARLARDAHRLAEAGSSARWCTPAWAGLPRATLRPVLTTLAVGESVEIAGELTTDFSVRLCGAAGVQVEAWPLRARWRDGTLVAIAPALCADSGTLQAGRYRHADLGVSLDAHGRTDRLLRRGHAHLAEAQVEVWRVGPRGDLDARVGAVLVATRVRPGEDEVSVQARLSDGATISGGARAAAGEERDFVGRGPAAVEAFTREWYVDAGDGERVRRERWLSVAVADRRVLLRLFAAGATHGAAQDALRDAHAWLADVVAAVAID